MRNPHDTEVCRFGFGQLPSCASGGAAKMRNRWWYWLACLIAAWQIITHTVRAFSVPWVWNADQCLTVFFGACLTVVSVVWVRVWKRGGMALVKARWAAADRGRTPSKAFFGFSLIFWIFVAIGLAVFFAMRHP